MCISFIETHYQEGPRGHRGDNATPRKVQGHWLDNEICVVLFTVLSVGQYRKRLHRPGATAQTAAVASCVPVDLTLGSSWHGTSGGGGYFSRLACCA